MRQFEYILVTVHLPGLKPIAFGILLLDPAVDNLYYRFRKTLPDGVPPEDREVILGLPDYCRSIAETMGGEALLRYLLDSASNTIRVTDAMNIEAESAPEALSTVYAEHVM